MKMSNTTPKPNKMYKVYPINPVESMFANNNCIRKNIDIIKKSPVFLKIDFNLYVPEIVSFSANNKKEVPINAAATSQTKLLSVIVSQSTSIFMNELIKFAAIDEIKIIGVRAIIPLRAVNPMKSGFKGGNTLLLSLIMLFVISVKKPNKKNPVIIVMNQKPV